MRGWKYSISLVLGKKQQFNITLYYLYYLSGRSLGYIYIHAITTYHVMYLISVDTSYSYSTQKSVQTGSGAHPASCKMGTEGPFPGGKARPERDADHSPPSSAEVVIV
jgi:hypothetical protein